jgi:DNA polymerase epsilon subunit 1
LLQLGAVLRPKVALLKPYFDSAGALTKHEFTPDEFDPVTDKLYLHFLAKLPYIAVYHSGTGVRDVWIVLISSLRKACIFISAPGMREKVSYHAVVKGKLGWETSITEYFSSASKVFPALKKLIMEEKRGGAVLFAAGNPDPATLQVLTSCDLPIVRPDDEGYHLPGIDWERSALNWALTSYSDLQSNLSEMLSYCRYGNIPIGNLPSDPAVFLCDILLGRSLRASKSLLWWSDCHKPDFGGREEDWTERDFRFTEIIRPGLFHQFVVEIDLGAVPANALLCYKALTEEESLEDNPWDDRAVSQRAFSTLRKLTSIWYEDIIQRKNIVADALTMHFYRWVSSPKSALYDPALHYSVHLIIQQMLGQLVAECARLGAEVIYSHSEKLIINTRRGTFEDAEDYCRFLQTTISANPKFARLQLTPTRYWEIFLFKDVHNFAGRLVVDSESMLIYQLHVLEYLPEELEQYARSLFGELLSKCANLDANSDPVAFLKRYIREDLTRKLLDKVPALQVGASSGRWEYPVKLGQRLLGNPALTFVKVIIHLFQLEPELEEEASLLRRSLLQLMHIGEYGKEVEYTEPCASLVLPEITCRKCLSLRDLDLCRDSKLSHGLFECSCDSPLDKGEIQAKLLTQLQEQLQRYYKQDLKCKKCKYTMSSYLRPLCACAGRYVKKIEAGEIRGLKRVVQEAAAMFEMEWLGEVLRVLSI